MNADSWALDVDFVENCLLKTVYLANVSGNFNNNEFTKKMSQLSKLANLNIFKMGYYSIPIGYDFTSLSTIEKLSKTLTEIDIPGFEKLSNIEGLSSFTNLKKLNLNNCDVSDLSCLKNCTKLTNLSLNNNRIVNLSVLSNMLSLNELNLQNNLIEDTASSGEEKINNLDILLDLYNKGNLRKLNISGNLIIDMNKLRSVHWETKDF